MAVKILKEGGALAFYRGFGANMLNTFSMQLCVILVFDRHSTKGEANRGQTPNQRLLLLLHSRAEHLHQALPARQVDDGVSVEFAR